MTNEEVFRKVILHAAEKNKKETIPNLAILLWKTPCIVTLLIQEIIRVYPYLSPPTLSSGDSTRVCNALSLFQGGSDLEVILYLLQTEFVPLCLCSIEKGSPTSKTLATFILEKILVTDIGLRYACATAERFFCLHMILCSMVASSTEQPSARLLRHIIRCYLRLSLHPRYLQDEDVTRVALTQLLDNTTNNQCLCGELASDKK
ncbi:cell differentiation protein RCD1 isoform X3 [Carex littledalei]|uniref:Cell differentiation protein RCD1 isoform X3 n=1 Tax=Carex littledalei TaxID=544730 RepID=A0A833VGW4_9POAL|nr:cell differentiation protein RCD1 isoform X3 [Carex littledalei]